MGQSTCEQIVIVLLDRSQNLRLGLCWFPPVHSRRDEKARALSPIVFFPSSHAMRVETECMQTSAVQTTTQVTAFECQQQINFYANLREKTSSFSTPLLRFFLFTGKCDRVSD
jgi:hypothetical protein